ncbi:MAG TPA: MFS transporter [Candidatus Sulfotelmatobacter sp.]|nr:MFS transporter [Candidatus Sulfotelmatobacter sp.]
MDERIVMPATARAGAGGTARFVTLLVLLWLSGIGLRLTILAVPPVIPLIHADLRMSETGIGVLTGLAPLLFACAAIPGSALIARFGVRRTLIGGLMLTALASALRGAAPDVSALYAATFFMCMGVAFMQPAMPPMVREWWPTRVALGIAVYSNGLLVGEVLPPWLNPYLLPLIGGSWRWSFVVWSLPVLLTAVLVRSLTPHPVAAAGSALPAQRWWPDWRDPLIWRLGLVMGGVNALYLASNAFLPDYLHQSGRPELIGAALTALNAGQLPASFLMLAVAGRLTRRRWPYVASGILSLACVAGMVSLPGAGVVVSAGVLGFSNAFGLILALALPPLLCAAPDVPRMSAGMFTISYPCAVLVSVVSGWAWDATGVPLAAFVPVGLSAVMMIALASTLDLSRKPS